MVLVQKEYSFLLAKILQTTAAIYSLHDRETIDLCLHQNKTRKTRKKNTASEYINVKTSAQF